MHATPLREEIRALTFDVFGTLVDWRSSIIREGQELSRRYGLSVDWPAFAMAWRAGYQPAMDQVRKGDIEWTNLDALHRQILDQLLPQFGLEQLPLSEVSQLNLVWHRLTPWPDVVSGLEQLRKQKIIASLSNGNVALLVNMAKQAGMTWDTILSAELARRYKPDPEVYRMAVQLLGLKAEQVMMVAAHNGDLQAAAAVGMRTAFIPRPLEYGPDQTTDLQPQTAIDFVANDLHELARQLNG